MHWTVAYLFISATVASDSPPVDNKGQVVQAEAVNRQGQWTLVHHVNAAQVNVYSQKNGS